MPLKCTLLLLFSSVHFDTHADVFINCGLVRYLKIHENLKNQGLFFHTWEGFLKMFFWGQGLGKFWHFVIMVICRTKDLEEAGRPVMDDERKIPRLFS